MIKRQWQATQSVRKRLCTSIPTSRAAPKKGYGFFKQQHVKGDLIG
jgi:hypothetical protein